MRVFEIGAIFKRDECGTGWPAVRGRLFDQPKRVAAMAYGPAVDEQWGAPAAHVDYFDVKADLEALFAPRQLRFVKAEHPALHPGRSAEVDARRRA